MGSENTGVWVCLVCGYVHRSPEPPATCPVCGASIDEFEAHVETLGPPSRAEVLQWRCLICNYIHLGSAPPSECPVCGASTEDFEPLEDTPETPRSSTAPSKALIIGAGVAGVSAAEALRQAAPDTDITLVSREPDLPYYRLNLTRFLAGEIDETALPIHPETWYKDQRIRLLRGCEITAVLPDERTVEINTGPSESFDKLIITCGAHPFIPPIPGAAREGVIPLRTLADAKRILESARSGIECVCIGGGILGLEAAGALARRGVRVTLLESYEWLLPRQLNREAGHILERYVEDLGIRIRRQAKTAEILGDEHAEGVMLADGAVLPARLVLVTTGVRPNSYLARRAGLEVKQGIVVDSRLTSSHPRILAAGDVAEHQGRLYGLWDPARYQGSIAGMNAAGIETDFGGLPRTNALKVLGIGLFSIGEVVPQDGSFTEISEESDGNYCRFLIRDGLLVGAILLGDTHLTSAVAAAVKNRADFSKVLAKRPAAKDVVSFLAG